MERALLRPVAGLLRHRLRFLSISWRSLRWDRQLPLDNVQEEGEDGEEGGEEEEWGREEEEGD